MKSGRMASSEGPPPGMVTQQKEHEPVVDPEGDDFIPQTEQPDYLAEMENIINTDAHYGSEAEEPREGWHADIEHEVDAEAPLPDRGHVVSSDDPLPYQREEQEQNRRKAEEQRYDDLPPVEQPPMQDQPPPATQDYEQQQQQQQPNRPAPTQRPGTGKYGRPPPARNRGGAPSRAFGKRAGRPGHAEL